MSKYYISIDQGTTSSRAVLYDSSFNQITQEQQEFKQHYPADGLVEHDPEEIWTSVLITVNSLMSKKGIKSSDVISIGITNQRETVMLWDKDGKVLDKAIVWQDRRTTEFCEELKAKGVESEVTKKTGLLLDPYFSATKARWLLKKHKIDPSKYFFGTIDTFLVWKLTEGKSFKTDVTNASRTLLLNIDSVEWDMNLIDIFEYIKISTDDILEIHKDEDPENGDEGGQNGH